MGKKQQPVNLTLDPFFLYKTIDHVEGDSIDPRTLEQISTELNARKPRQIIPKKRMVTQQLSEFIMRKKTPGLLWNKNIFPVTALM